MVKTMEEESKLIFDIEIEIFLIFSQNYKNISKNMERKRANKD